MANKHGMTKSVARHFAKGMQRIVSEVLDEQAIIKAGGRTVPLAPPPKRGAKQFRFPSL